VLKNIKRGGPAKGTAKGKGKGEKVPSRKKKGEEKIVVPKGVKGRRTKKSNAENQELRDLCVIFGFQMGMVYTAENINQLRYRYAIMMADADADGSHIKGRAFIGVLVCLW